VIAAQHERHPAVGNEFFCATSEFFGNGGNDSEGVIPGWRRDGGAPCRVQASQAQPTCQSLPAQRRGSISATGVGCAGAASDADDANRRAGFDTVRLVGLDCYFFRSFN